jgi:hypothetical protein
MEEKEGSRLWLRTETPSSQGDKEKKRELLSSLPVRGIPERDRIEPTSLPGTHPPRTGSGAEDRSGENLPAGPLLQNPTGLGSSDVPGSQGAVGLTTTEGARIRDTAGREASE